MQDVEEEVERQVITLVSEYFSVGHKTVKSSSRLIEDLYVDSMNVVEIVMIVAETFNVQIPPAEVGEWKTVSDICFSVYQRSVRFNL